MCDLRSNAERGFTLIEGLVTIAVIVLLAGLSLTVLGSVTRASEVRQTEIALRQLDMATTEWQTAAERRLTWGDDGVPTPEAKYDIDPGLHIHLILPRILSIIERHEGTRQLLASVDPDLILRLDPYNPPRWLGTTYYPFSDTWTVVDPWGTPIYALHPGGKWTDGMPVQRRDVDGTYQTDNERRFGVAPNASVCYVSAGPDRDFGIMSAPEDSAAFKATLDNICSLPLGRSN